MRCPITLDYNTFDGIFSPFPASGGVDYTPTTGSLTFPATDADSASQTISVPITGGLDPLNPEEFGLSLNNIQNANDDGDSAQGTINNDNVAPGVGFDFFSDTVSMSENDQSNGGNMSFDVSLNAFLYAGRHRPLRHGGRDRLRRRRLHPGQRHIDHPGGQTDGTIEVPIINNTIVDGDRNFTVVLSNPTNATLHQLQCNRNR